MTDFNFDPNTMTRAYAQRKALTEEENVRPKARPKGIASKPDDGNTDTSSDEPNFYDKMLDELLGYFSSEDDANKVLSDKTPDRQDTQTSYEDMFGGLSQETRDAVEQAKQKRMGPADRRDVDVVEKEVITEETKPITPKIDLSDLQIMKPEGIEDMPPLPKPATDDGGLMSRDTPTEKGETTTDTGLMSKSKVKEDTGYTVKSGDTFDEIAKDNNITPADLRAANPDISDYNKIIVGQEINLGSSKIGEGLTDDDMGLPDDRSTTEKDMSFNTAFVTKMAKSEGEVDHVDSLGIPTLGYGILPATARKYGFDPDSAEYSDRKVLAEAVYDAMYKEAKTSYSDVFANLNESQKIGVLSLYINLGELPDGVVTALSSATPDFDAARDSLSTVVLGSPRDGAGNRKKDSNKNTIYTSNKGLSKRRAGEYNILMENQSGFIPVKTVSVEGTKQTPVFVWKDKDGKEIRRYTPTVTGQGKVYQGLDDSSTMTDVSV